MPSSTKQIQRLFTEKSRWIWHPEIAPRTPCYVFFRNAFSVGEANCRLRISVSADNRYNLLLDGKTIGRGPCRSDIHHYNFETYDLDISPGDHALCAHVAVFGVGCRGKEVALAEMHSDSGFILAGGVFKDGSLIHGLETPGVWKCNLDESRRHRPLDADYDLRTFAVISPMETFIRCKYPAGWTNHSFDDSGWLAPCDSGPAVFREKMEDPYTKWWLVPRTVPMMEEKDGVFSSLLSCAGLGSDKEHSSWLSGDSPLTVAGNAKIVLDAGALTTAFPILRISGGAGARLRLRYSESLFVDGKKLERDRKDGEVFGYADLVEADGSDFIFESFWFRTFRFVAIEIEAGNEALRLHAPRYRTFMYPFELKASFECGDCEIRRVWDIAWRTARLCAHEHYYDCPYYEQLQYTGDTRIQALISYAATGDDRLGRQAIRHYDRSRLPEGITQSRYPSTWTQVIVGFSLYWVMMIKDHYDYFGDTEFIRELAPGIGSVLDWFERRVGEDGLLGHLPYWNFTDWLPEWPNGNPARGMQKSLTINTMQYAEACRNAAFLMEACGRQALSREYLKRHQRSLKALDKHCFDKEKGLYADMPGAQFFSQHVNAWAILCDAVRGKKAKLLAKRIYENEANMSKATLYFSFYLFRAWEKTGDCEYFWKKLDDWKSVLKWNFTTFPEIPREDCRSDCHAWSSSPIFEFITGSLGIKPGSPGFETVLFSPKPPICGETSGQAPIGSDGLAQVKIRKEPGQKLHVELRLDRPRRVVLKWPDGGSEDLGECDFHEFLL